MPVYIVDKPLGVSSHDVVAAARRALGTRRVGHAGTLDPLATGVLVLLVEDATKLSPFLTGSDKHYLAWVAFGAGTPTLDAEGPIDARADPTGLTAPAIASALSPFLSLTEQRPPAYSAVKRGGVKGYQAARRGDTLELPPRPAGYRRVELLGFAPKRGALPDRFAPDAAGVWRAAADGRSFALPLTLDDLPTALVSLTVLAGTYIRAFALDLGAALGVPAHLAGLVRTRAGAFDLGRSVMLDALASAPSLSERDALPYPLVELSEAEAARVRQGQRLPLSFEGRVGLVDDAGLVAVAEADGERMKLLRVFG